VPITTYSIVDAPMSVASPAGAIVEVVYDDGDATTRCETTTLSPQLEGRQVRTREKRGPGLRLGSEAGSGPFLASQDHPFA
jgi:hypothetical protein